jgi:hypothetical protein
MPIVRHKQIAVNEKYVGLHAGKTVSERIMQGSVVPVVIVSVGLRQRYDRSDGRL